MNITLIYFDFPFWRAETARIALYSKKIPFNDPRVTKEAFKQIKETGKLNDKTIIPFHQLPCLVVDGLSIAQTGAIVRFCGKMTGLYPKKDDLTAAKIDECIDFLTEVTVAISQTMKGETNDMIRDQRKQLYESTLLRKFHMLDKNICHDNHWSVGKTMTIADIAIWCFFSWLSCGRLEGMPTNLLKDLPNINKICLSVEESEIVQHWIMNTYPKNYPKGNFYHSMTD